MMGWDKIHDAHNLVFLGRVFFCRNCAVMLRLLTTIFFTFLESTCHDQTRRSKQKNRPIWPTYGTFPVGNTLVIMKRAGKIHFQPIYNEMKRVLTVKESYSKGEKAKFSQPDYKMTVFFTSSLSFILRQLVTRHNLTKNIIP